MPAESARGERRDAGGPEGPGPGRVRVVFLGAAGAVVAWRLAALGLAATSPAAGDPGLAVRILLAALGLAFLACGWIVLARRVEPAARLFAAWCLGSGLHWGGPLDLPAGDARAALLFFYLVASGVLAAALLLHLALRVPRRTPLADSRLVVGSLYAPAGVAAALAIAYLAAPAGGSTRTALQGPFLLLHGAVTNLYGALALVVIGSLWLRRTAGRAERRHAGLLVAAMLVAWVPYLVASAVGTATDPWNLTMIALPATFAFVLLRRPAAPPGDHEAAGPGGSRPRAAAASALGLAALVGLAAPPLHATAGGPSPTVLPSDTCQGLFVVPVRFGADGRRTTLQLLLDTGSSRTYVDPSAFTGLPRRAGKMVLRRAGIGAFELGRLEVRLLPMANVSGALGREIDGILGFPAFRDVLLTLDYPAREIRVERGALARPDGREIFRYGGAKRPHLRIDFGHRRLDVLLDSGATGRFTLPPGPRISWSVPPRRATSARTIDRVVVHEAGRLQAGVVVGPLRFEEPIVTLSGREPIAGWHVLRHFALTFDQRSRRVRLRAASAGPERMGPLVGTGLVTRPRAEGEEVVELLPDSSAADSGLRPGDLVLELDDVPLGERGCRDPVGEAPGRSHRVTYARDGLRHEATLSTRVLVP